MMTDAEYRSRYENDIEEDNEDVTKRRRTVKKWSKEEVSSVLVTCTLIWNNELSPFLRMN